jgi:hypothetical protein
MTGYGAQGSLGIPRYDLLSEWVTVCLRRTRATCNERELVGAETKGLAGPPHEVEESRKVINLVDAL